MKTHPSSIKPRPKRSERPYLTIAGSTGFSVSSRASTLSEQKIPPNLLMALRPTKAFG